MIHLDFTDLHGAATGPESAAIAEWAIENGLGSAITVELPSPAGGVVTFIEPALSPTGQTIMVDPNAVSPRDAYLLHHRVTTVGPFPAKAARLLPVEVDDWLPWRPVTISPLAAICDPITIIREAWTPVGLIGAGLS